MKLHHEYLLSGLTKEHVLYDQLSVTEWVASLGRTMRDESDLENRQHMPDYLISLMGDANDIFWILAKASHRVLLCRVAQGAARSYADTLAIDWMLRANAQKHMPVSKTT